MVSTETPGDAQFERAHHEDGIVSGVGAGVPIPGGLAPGLTAGLVPGLVTSHSAPSFRLLSDNNEKGLFDVTDGLSPGPVIHFAEVVRRQPQLVVRVSGAHH
ncbi:uncharacterized protein PG998_009450 [Apiospora kogelbergensis]|uniref:uncharacterized protein n=1 Tax=Apiospora kogelbergensis TaxID=1337665 RepID=UPI00312E283E